MSENEKTPFEQAEENIKVFIENADMMQSLSNLKQILDESENLSEYEQKSVSLIVEATIKTLSKYLTDRGHEWN